MAVLFLGICASAILNTATSARSSATYATRRAALLARVEDEIDLARRIAVAGSLTTGTTTFTGAVSGVAGNVTITRTTTLLTGYTDLYDVVATASWTEPTSSGSRADSMTLQTYVRDVDE